MGIKAGSGKGSVDAGGSKKEVPGGVGSGRKKRPPFMPPPPPKKPLQPTADNPFPEKKDFRLGQYRVLEERDDYLLCTGFDPNAKNPFSEVTPSAFRTGALLKIAKPPALQRTVWEATPVTIDGVEYTYAYDDAEYGVRTVTGDDDSEEEQRIDPPYVLPTGIGDIIVAVQIRKSAAVDGMEVQDEEGTRLRWVDLNVSGRHWKGPGGSSEECPNNFRIIVVGNPTAGSFDLTLVLPGGSDSFTLDWDATRSDLDAAIEGHAHWDAGYTLSVADGPFPMNSLSFQLGGAGTIAQPTVSNITFSGGARSGVRIERACCEEAV
jgi:hypothetical protein